MFLLVLVWTQNVSLASSPLRVTYVEFPPVTYTNERGETVGFLVSTMKKILEEAGFHEYTVRSYPRKRLVLKLINGEVDLWVGVGSGPSLKDHTLVGKNTIAEIFFRAYYTKNVPGVYRKEDLEGQRVIVMRGYSYGGLMEYIRDSRNNVRFFEADTHEQALKALREDRGDYLLSYKRPVEASLLTTPVGVLNHNDIAILKLRFIVSRKTPDAENVLGRLDSAFARLKQKKIF